MRFFNMTRQTLATLLLCAITSYTTTTVATTISDTTTLTACSTVTDDTAPLKQWTVGKEVSLAAIKKYGIDNCFKQSNINSQVFNRINGKSFKTNCTVPRSSLRYLQLLHYTQEGRIKIGEMICHKDVASELISIFRQLFDAKYPIERMQLIDDFNANDIESMNKNNTSCFNFRMVAGSKKLSNHSLGKAVDINPLYNPYVKRRANGTYKVSPEAGRKYTDRSKPFKYKIDKNDLAYKLFTQHGFRWGGNYRTLKDYQHFEK